MPPAYFLSLSIENIRCFGPRQSLDLSDGKGRPARWTVLLGTNGSGKTTLLQALISFEPSLLTKNGDIILVPHFSPDRGAIFRLNETSKKFYESNFSAELLIGNPYGKPTQTTYKENLNINLSQAKSSTYLVWSTNSLLVVDKFEMICCAYGGNRAVGAPELSDIAHDSPIGSLVSDNYPLRDAEEWLLQADYRASKRSDIQAEARTRLREIKEVLINLLPDVDEIRFSDPQTVSETSRAEFHTPYGWVPLSELGLGYRSTIAWVVDFASRLFEHYPDSANPLAEPAVCLVDEIDLHLHPTWQRSIMTYLSERFPNTQFIVTAHSPLIVQAASEDANIALLRREGDHVVIDQSFTGIRGWRIDQLLTSDLFGLETARPPQYEAAIKERTKILGKSRLTKKDKARLGELEKELEAMPAGETAADIEAMDLIREAAKHLKQAGE